MSLGCMSLPAFAAGETVLPAIPTATTTPYKTQEQLSGLVEAMDTELSGNLVAAMQFTYDADEDSDTTEFYEDWKADFSLSFDKGIPAGTVTPVGAYGSIGPLTLDPLKELAANEPFMIMTEGMKFPITYEFVRSFVKNFYCGLLITDEGTLEPNTTATLQLRLYASDALMELFAGSSTDEALAILKQTYADDASQTILGSLKYDTAGVYAYRPYFEITTDEFLLNPAVAQIGETTYPTLADAVAAAQSGETVKLLQDIDVSAIIEITKSITIEGGNHKIATTANRALWIDASDVEVTLKDIEFAGDKNKTERAVQVNTDCDDVTLNIDNCKMNATYYAVNVCGSVDDLTLNIANSNITGWGAINLWGNNGTVTIKNTTLTGINDKSYNVEGWNDFGVVVIEGDTTGQTDMHASAYNVVLNNCTIEAKATTGNTQSVILFNNPSVQNTVTITGEGTKVHYAKADDLAANMGSENVLDIQAGTFDHDPTDFLGPNYEAKQNESSKWVVTPATTPYVAQIGTTRYTTLVDAFAAAQDGNTIKLLADCAGNGIKVPQGKFTTGLTVDFAGYTYTVDGETVGSAGTETNGFQLLKDNKITFKNGWLYSEKAKILVQNYSNLTLDNMLLLMDNENYTSAYTLSNNNGNVLIKNTAICANPAGGFAFDVCRYASYPAVHVTVSDGSYIDGDIEIFASKSDAKDGFSLALESGTLYGNIVMDPSAAAAMAATPAKVSITKSSTDFYSNLEYDDDGNEVGELYTAAPTGYKWANNTTLTKIGENTVAMIGDTEYATLAEAIQAAKSGDTITMVADVENAVGMKVASGKNFTVDFAGHTYTVSKPGAGSTGTETNGFQLLKGSTIVFKNGKLAVSEDNLTAATTGNNIKRLIQNYANLTLENMEIDAQNQYGTYQGGKYGLSFNNGTSVIKNSTIIVSNSETVAFDVCTWDSYVDTCVTVENSTVGGKIEVSSTNDPTTLSLNLTGSTTASEIVMAGGSDKAVVTKDGTIGIAAPTDYKWSDAVEGVQTLTKKTYLAQIGTTKFETLAEAVAAAQDGDTITLLADVTQDDGVLFNKAGATVELDLNDKTFTVNEGSNVNSRAIRIDNGTLEVYGGSIVAVGGGTTSSDGTGCYGAFRVEANGKLIAHDLRLSNARPWGLNVKVCGGEAELTNVTINSSYGGGIEVTEADLGNNSKPGVATLTNCTFNQSGYYDHCSTALSVSGGSVLNVKSGSYTGEYALYVFSSGGVINVEGGTFEAKSKNAIIAAIDLNTYPGYTGGLTISGGDFTGTYDIKSPAYLSITGGTFSKDPAAYVAAGYEAKRLGDNGKYVVGLKAIDTKVTVGESQVDAVQVVTDTAATSTEVNNQTVAEKIVTTTTYNVDNGNVIKSEPTQIKAVATENASTYYTATITPINADGTPAGESKSVDNAVGVAEASKEIDKTNNELMTGLSSAGIDEDTYEPTTTVDNAESKAESAVEIETIVAELTGKIVATADADKVDAAVTKGVDVKLTVEPTLTGAGKDTSDPSKTVLSYEFTLYATAYEKDTPNELSKMAVSNDLIKDDQEITFYVNIPTELQGKVSAIIVKHNNVAMDGAKYELTDNGTKFKVTTTGFSPYEVEFFSSSIEKANLSDVNYVAGYTLTLNDRIDVNFYMHLTSDVRNDPNSYMEITFAGLTNGHEDRVDVSTYQMESTTPEGMSGDFYKFTYAVAPSEGDKAITLKLHTSNGILPIYNANGVAADNGWYTRTLNEVTRVAVDYGSEDLKPLAKKLLAYCRYTQGYFAERDVDLDIGLDVPNLSAAKDALDTNFTRGNVNLPDDVGYEGTRLVLDSETSIKIYLSGNVKGYSYSYSDGSNTFSLTPVKSGSRYYFKITNLDATKLNKKFAVYAGDTKIFDYSVLTWAQSLIGKSEAYKQNLAAAMYEYNAAARTYFKVTN